MNLATLPTTGQPLTTSPHRTTLACRALLTAALLLPVQAVQAQTFEAQLFDHVNAERLAAGVSPLGLDPRLQLAAHAHAVDMATHGCNSHDACDGTPWSVLVGPYASGTTLNLVGTGYTTPDAMLNGWLSSTDHRAWLLAPMFQGGGTGFQDQRWTLALGTLPPVPEPSSWALLASGLGAVALRLLRRGQPA